jgi:hypothetical protein
VEKVLTFKLKLFDKIVSGLYGVMEEERKIIKGNDFE